MCRDDGKHTRLIAITFILSHTVTYIYDETGHELDEPTIQPTGKVLTLEVQGDCRRQLSARQSLDVSCRPPRADILELRASSSGSSAAGAEASAISATIVYHPDRRYVHIHIS